MVTKNQNNIPEKDATKAGGLYSMNDRFSTAMKGEITIDQILL